MRTGFIAEYFHTGGLMFVVVVVSYNGSGTGRLTTNCKPKTTNTLLDTRTFKTLISHDMSIHFTTTSDENNFPIVFNNKDYYSVGSFSILEYSFNHLKQLRKFQSGFKSIARDRPQKVSVTR